MLNDLEKKYSELIKNFDKDLENKITLKSDLKEKNFPMEKITNFNFSYLTILQESNNDQDNKIKREILNETKYAQPAILLHSYLNYLKFKEDFLIKNDSEFINASKNNFFFGPSLGEIISLVAAGCLDLNKAGDMLYNRGNFMQESCPKNIGSMLNVVGEINKTIHLFEDFVKNFDKQKNENLNNKIFNNFDNEINISSIMNKRLIVISGKANVIEECAKYMKNNNIACRKLIVSAAFHSRLMLEGSEKFKVYLFDKKNDIKFSFPEVNVLSTIDPKFVYLKKDLNNLTENDFDTKVKNLLVEQFIKKVDILGCIEKYFYENTTKDKEAFGIYDIVKRKIIDLNEFI